MDSLSSAQTRGLLATRPAPSLILLFLTIALVLFGMVAAAAGSAPKGYQQTNLISNGAVDAVFTDKNFVDPWGISIGQAFWINTNVTGLNYIAGPSGAISFTVTIPPASGSGPGSPTGTVYSGNVPSGTFLLPDKSSPVFLFCTLDGTVSGWSGSSDTALISLNSSKANAVYNDMALLTNSSGTYLLLSNFGAGADVEVYDKDYKRTMTGAFKDPHVPATYAPYAVHVFNGTVYVTYTPRTVPGYQEILGAGHGFVDAFDDTGKFLSRVIPIGDKLDAPWGMAIAPTTFGTFGGDVLVGNFGDGTIGAYDPKTYEFKGQITDGDGNVIANPGLWEIVFGQVQPAVGDPNTLYFTAGLNHETAGLFGTITVGSTELTKTKTTVTSDGNPDTKGAKVTFTALVQPDSGTGEPEGHVAFAVDGKPLAISPVDSTAHAAATTKALAIGKHVITAAYSGDDNFGKSSGTTTETIKAPATAAPAISPAAGSYSTAKTISITDATLHATIYYTTNGSTPTIKSTVYSKPFKISKTTTIKAVATATGLAESAVSSAKYTITIGGTPAPTFTPGLGQFTSSQSVTLADSAKGAVIYYTLDSSTPTVKSAVYSKAISVTKTTTIKAFAVAANVQPSAIVSATYTISSASATDAPTFSPAPGTYTAAQSVVLADGTGGAVIHFTTDGSTPTASSPVYTKAISVSATMTIKAMAEAPNWAPSTVATANYTISTYGW
jgi:uncharacterized protein (TIGR03118 family)